MKSYSFDDSCKTTAIYSAYCANTDISSIYRSSYWYKLGKMWIIYQPTNPTLLYKLPQEAWVYSSLINGKSTFNRYRIMCYSKIGECIYYHTIKAENSDAIHSTMVICITDDEICNFVAVANTCHIVITNGSNRYTFKESVEILDLSIICREYDPSIKDLQEFVCKYIGIRRLMHTNTDRKSVV